MAEQSVSSEKRIFHDRLLPCGVYLSTISERSFNIQTGEASLFVPKNLQFDPGVNREKEMLSGEAIIFPHDKGIVFMVGRSDKADITIDADFVERLSGEEYLPLDYAASIDQISSRLQKHGYEPLRLVVDIGDTGISRFQLQVSNHPDGETVVAYSPVFGKKHREIDRVTVLTKYIVGGPKVLRNYLKEPLIHELQSAFHSGTQALHNGDVVIIEGIKRIVCLRFFEAVDEKGLEFKPAMLIKQSYPAGTTVKTIHEEIIKKEATESLETLQEKK